MKKIGLGVIIFGVILASIAALAETALIIRLGIRMFSVLSILPYFASIVGVIILIAGFAPAIKARLAAKSEIKQEEKEREARSRPTLSYTADFYDPADIRRRLADLKKRRPDLIGVLEKCEAQMDAMDRRQAKLKDLLDLNEAEYLRATENLLDEVEQFICKNFRKVINRGIVSDPEDDRVFSRDEKYSTHA